MTTYKQSVTTVTSSHSQCYGAVFGGKALELVGRVVHPDFQQQGLGTAMLANLIATAQPEFLTTYTRNPSILRMIATVSDALYPIVSDDELMQLASQMDSATSHDVIYHLNRYDEGGLFVGSDPAEREYTTGDGALKYRFTELTGVRNALVVAARVKR